MNIAKISEDTKLQKIVIYDLLERVKELNKLDERQLFTWIIGHYAGEFQDYKDMGVYLVSERAKQSLPDWLEYYVDFGEYARDQEEKGNILIISFLKYDLEDSCCLFELDKKE